MSWPLVKLGSVATVLNGRAYNKDELLSEGKYPVLRVGNFFSNREWYYSDLELEDKNYCDKGDLLYAWSASFGPKIWDGGKVIYHYHIWKLVLDECQVDKKYLYYFLQRDVEKIKKDHGAGSTMIHITKGAMEERLVSLPPLSEQKRIAAILDKADAIRRKRQQAIKLADDFLRSVFLEMFGDLSKGEMTKFGDVVSLDAKMVDPREEAFIDLVHIGPDRIEKETGKLLPALTAREEILISKKFLFDESYVLYSKIRPYLKKCALAKGVGLCSADMYPIKPIEGKTTREFIWMLLLSNIFSSYTETLPDRASIPKLNRAELADFEFALPDYVIQRRYSQVVTTVVSIKEKIDSSEQMINSLFGGMSQKAFSGQF